MASQDEVKGEGFEVLGHEETEKADQETDAREGGAGKAHDEDVRGKGFEGLGHKEPQGGDAQEETAAESADETGMKAIDVYSVLRLSVAQLAGVAWQMMATTGRGDADRLGSRSNRDSLPTNSSRLTVPTLGQYAARRGRGCGAGASIRVPAYPANLRSSALRFASPPSRK